MANGQPETDDPVDRAVEAAAALAGVTVTPEQRAGVRTHLGVGLAIAGRIGRVGAEAAPMFRP